MMLRLIIGPRTVLLKFVAFFFFNDASASSAGTMPEITANVSFDTIAVSCRTLLMRALGHTCLRVPALSNTLSMPALSNTLSASSSQREWRCKWSPDADKASLSAAQDALTEILAEVRSPRAPCKPLHLLLSKEARTRRSASSSHCVLPA